MLLTGFCSLWPSELGFCLTSPGYLPCAVCRAESSVPAWCVFSLRIRICVLQRNRTSHGYSVCVHAHVCSYWFVFAPPPALPSTPILPLAFFDGFCGSAHLPMPFVTRSFWSCQICFLDHFGGGGGGEGWREDRSPVSSMRRLHAPGCSK